MGRRRKKVISLFLNFYSKMASILLEKVVKLREEEHVGGTNYANDSWGTRASQLKTIQPLSCRFSSQSHPHSINLLALLLLLLSSAVKHIIVCRRGITASSSNDGLAFTMMRLQIEEEKKKKRKCGMSIFAYSQISTSQIRNKSNQSRNHSLTLERF